MQRHIFDIQRRVVAHKTTESWQNAPHVSLMLDLDVTRLNLFIQELRQDPQFVNTRITLNALLIKLIAHALKKSPRMNAHVDYNPVMSAGEVRLLEGVSISMPFRIADGRTITPVMPQVDQRSLLDLCQAMEDLKRRVYNTDIDCLLLEAGLNDTWLRLRRNPFSVLLRLYANFLGPRRLPKRPSRETRQRYNQLTAADRITPEELLSASVLVSNIGSTARECQVYFGLLEIIAPHTTVIGLASARRRPWVITHPDGTETIEIRSILPMTICFDHRAMDFDHVTGFLHEAVALSENPASLLQPATVSPGSASA